MTSATPASDFVAAAVSAWDPSTVPDELKDPQTPADVIVGLAARTPETDPTLNIPVPAATGAQPTHRLVALGDSLTQGFQSGAIFNTDLSYPAMIARELGWYDSFRHPEYRAFGGLGFNLEFLIRQLEAQYGATLNWWDLGAAVFFVHQLLTQARDYWEHGAGSQIPSSPAIMHNLAISGYDIRDILSQTADTERASMITPQDPLLNPMIANSGQLIALYVLDSARDDSGKALTPVEAAAALSNDGGVETLIIFIGSNNALRTVVDLKVKWSDTGYDTLAGKGAYNMWRPTHFAAELDALAESIEAGSARHVIWSTVPHVTIAPIAHGIGGKMRPGSRYFPYYTRPWTEVQTFDASVDPYITGNQARAIDSAIDQYNDAIAAVVRYGRQKGLDWLLLDTAGLLDRVAARRYQLDPAARPAWWTPYTLPSPVASLNPTPDSLFFASDTAGRTAGGLFSLDGVHATSITYAILAQEFINVMQTAGVTFCQADGTTPRTGPVSIDFGRTIARDTLISDPPKSLSSDFRSISWVNDIVDWVRRLAALL